MASASKELPEGTVTFLFTDIEGSTALHRGHGWAPSNEMAGSMLIPTAGVIVLLAFGLVTEIGTLLAIEHVVMLPSMLVAMLLRREEYSGHHGRHSAHAASA